MIVNKALILKKSFPLGHENRPLAMQIIIDSKSVQKKEHPNTDKKSVSHHSGQ